ncbi:type II toxin-antitoxin system RelE/ParE family toxin [Actinokineospora guangxiensis]|uniref:Type II toxin-antitoxin system RelE/ParE family toxin n=1 Tax=Actinokineospora guangxiensis TaxID=1490288 RepID=A0ABW0EX52_9PSEU
MPRSFVFGVSAAARKEFWIVSKQNRRQGKIANSSGDVRPPWNWWRSSLNARPKAKEEFDALPDRPRAQLWKKVERFLAEESRRKEVDHLGGGIMEIRHRDGNNHFRVLFFRWCDRYIALTAFYKNQQKTPPVDLNRAKERMKSWRNTFGPGGG